MAFFSLHIKGGFSSQNMTLYLQVSRNGIIVLFELQGNAQILRFSAEPTQQILGTDFQSRYFFGLKWLKMSVDTSSGFSDLKMGPKRLI